MRLDVHNHAAPLSLVEFFADEPVFGIDVTSERHLSGGAEGEYEIQDAFCEADAKVTNLERAGLEGAVVSVDPPFFYYDVEIGAGTAVAEVVNEGLREMCRKRPDRLSWMATVPLADPGRAATMLAEQKALGCVGVEIGTSTGAHRLDEPMFEPFWACAEDLGLPVMLHPAYQHPHPGFDDFNLTNVIGNMLETTIAIERLIMSGTLDRFPDLRLVIVHSGGYLAYQQGRLRHARTVRKFPESAPLEPSAYFGQIRFDTLTHDRKAPAFLIDQVGPENMLLGTDLPCDMATPEPWEDLVAVVGPEMAATIANDNVAALFGLSAT